MVCRVAFADRAGFDVECSRPEGGCQVLMLVAARILGRWMRAPFGLAIDALDLRALLAGGQTEFHSAEAAYQLLIRLLHLLARP